MDSELPSMATGTEDADPVLAIMNASSALHRISELLQIEEEDVGMAFALDAIAGRIKRAIEAIDDSGRA